jgi:hypothetical protein
LYEKHFTVMNYRDPQRLKQINCEDFVPMFEAQYPDQKWGEIESRVCVALRQALEVSCFLGVLMLPHPFRQLSSLTCPMGWVRTRSRAHSTALT